MLELERIGLIACFNLGNLGKEKTFEDKYQLELGGSVDEGRNTP